MVPEIQLYVFAETKALWMTIKKGKFLAVNLILYGPCIILKYICNPTRYTIFDD